MTTTDQLPCLTSQMTPLGPSAVGRGDPDGLGGGRRGRGLAAPGSARIDGTEGIGVEVGHRGVRRGQQVGGGVLGAGDADEDRLAVARGDLEAHVAVAVVAREPAGPLLSRSRLSVAMAAVRVAKRWVSVWMYPCSSFLLSAHSSTPPRRAGRRRGGRRERRPPPWWCARRDEDGAAAGSLASCRAWLQRGSASAPQVERQQASRGAAACTRGCRVSPPSEWGRPRRRPQRRRPPQVARAMSARRQPAPGPRPSCTHGGR
jgi:hypothetical protein